MTQDLEIAEAFRRADLRLRLMLLGDGMSEPGAVKGEEARQRVTSALRQMREAFAQAIEQAQRPPATEEPMREETEPTPDPLLTPSEVADEVGVSVDAVYRAVKRNEIAALRHGNARRGAIRIPASEARRLRRSRS